jgi:pimeloyl-ACP methyl ester carboxylesterase
LLNRSKPLLIFSHGNSFPASTYGVMLHSLKERGFLCKSIEKLGHDARYPVSSNWPHLVQQLADFTAHEVEKSGQPAYLVGHSLGGFLSLMCAARHPLLGGLRVKGVVLLDAPVLGGWRATALSVAKRAMVVGSFSPGAVSSKRKQLWPSRDEAWAHFSSKKMFARWEPQVLHDYIDHGTHDAAPDSSHAGQRVLSFDRAVETAIYNTLPHNLEALLKRHPLKCPVSYVGGLHSVEMGRVGMALTEKVTKGRITMLEGSHLFPMEKPLATAAAVEAALLSFAN